MKIEEPFALYKNGEITRDELRGLYYHIGYYDGYLDKLPNPGNSPRHLTLLYDIGYGDGLRGHAYSFPSIVKFESLYR